MNKLKIEMKDMQQNELISKVDQLRRELFNLRLQAATSPVQDRRQLKKLRKSIACGLTFLHQKSLTSI